MLDALIGLVGTGGLGTVFGSLVGSVSKYANQRLEIKRNRDEMEHTYKMTKLQNEHDKLMADQKLLEKETEGRWRDSEKHWDTLMATVQAEANSHSGVSQEVADARGMFRMRLTVGLWIGVMFLVPASVWLDSLYLNKIVDALLFTATSAGAMWFGAKAVTSRHQ